MQLHIQSPLKLGLFQQSGEILLHADLGGQGKGKFIAEPKY